MATEGKAKKDALKDEIYIQEEYLTALFWCYPEYYSYFSDEKLNSKMFFNRVWGFYFGLGRYMYNAGIKIYDDITAEANVVQTGTKEKYEEYGGYETIAEIMEEVKDKKDNFDGYYSEVKKYQMLRGLRKLLGDQVTEVDGKYDYKRMTCEQVHTYWMDKINKLAMADGKVEEYYLLEGLHAAIQRWNTSPDLGMPFFRSKDLTKICNGWAFGHVYIFGGFGGKGKTSQTFNKVIMSSIKIKEKLLVVANEQGIDEFQKMLVITAIGILQSRAKEKDKSKYDFVRQRLDQGDFTEDEFRIIYEATALVEEWTEGDEKIIAFGFLEDYSIENLKNTIRHYANRGFRRVIIDTAKPTDGDKTGMARWERFTEDFKEIYKLARPNGGGLNLAIWCTVQLADAALGRRFLDEAALGESKKIKNEASVVFMGRSVWDDEYPGEDNALEVYRFEKDQWNDNSKSYSKVTVELEVGKQYYLLFTAKNRRGCDNNTGQDILVLEPDFNNNTWVEIGWTKVYRDRNYS